MSCRGIWPREATPTTVTTVQAAHAAIARYVAGGPTMSRVGWGVSVRKDQGPRCPGSGPMIVCTAPPAIGLAIMLRRGSLPWGVATFNLKTPECGHHILFLSQYPHHGGGNSHDDRTGRICARPSLGQGRSGQNAHHRRAHRRLGRALSAGGATRYLGRSGSCFTG